MKRKHNNDDLIDTVKYIAKDTLQPNDLAWRIKHENPDKYDEHLELFHGWMREDVQKLLKRFHSKSLYIAGGYVVTYNI